MNYTQDAEHIVLASLAISGTVDPTMTQHRRATVFRDLLNDGERKSFEMVHFTYREHTTVYAGLEIASRFLGFSDVTTCGLAPENEGFYRSDESGLFHEDSVEFEEHSNRMRDTLEEVTMSLLVAGVNTGQSIEQGAMTSGAYIVTRGSILDYHNLYSQMHRKVHPAVVKFAQDAWADLRTRYPALTEAIKEVVT